MNHRQLPAPGHRPRRGVRFAAGRCAWPACSASFVIDRQLQPWARARTCSDSCRARLGNAGRTALSCEHCAMVEDFCAEHERQRIELENALRADEDARPTARLGDWMRSYWEREPDAACDDLRSHDLLTVA